MSASPWVDLIPQSDAVQKRQREALEARYGQAPALPAVDDRWGLLPEFVRNNMVLRISQNPTAADTPEERQRKVQELLNDGNYDTAHELPKTADDAEVVSSLDLKTYLHRPVLDIDIPAALIPSSTPGHAHLYIDKPMTLTQYENLLWALVEAGIIEGGYANASSARGYTSVRLPWVKKPEVQP